MMVTMKLDGTEVRRRYRQVRRLWQEGGSREVLNRLRRAAAGRLAPTTLHLPVRQADLLAADLTKPRAWPSLSLGTREPIVINWVTTPPAPGSGGHTTMFRLIEHLERAGYLCRVYIYDVHGGDPSYFSSHVKEICPSFKGPVADVMKGMASAHAVVATSWQTAYPVFNDQCAGKRFYLVQDFEPWFYPAGGQSVLAENTYRMGFHAITAGRFLASKLKSEYGMAADAFEFGCDTEKYHLLNRDVRDGIVFYAKPDAPRRAFEVGVAALQLFKQRHPDLAIHLYGSAIGNLPFRFVDHGVLRPDQLNQIYNRCFAGLSLSMTNASLVPHEMLSAGCIPVVNDAKHNHIVLDNPFVHYAAPTPHALADALHAVVSNEDFDAFAASASASVSSMSWDAAGVMVEECLVRNLRRSNEALEPGSAPAPRRQAVPIGT